MNSTPAPWIVTHHPIVLAGNPCKAISVKNTTDEIVSICGVVGSVDETTAIANASLIAAAPEMLEALIALQETAIANINGTMDADAVNVLISGIFEKMINEAGL